MELNCVFCKVVRGEFGTEFVAESEHAVAFDDISPAAPTHVLVVPRKHLASLRELQDPVIAAELLQLVQTVAEVKGLTESGYRVITNDGAEAGQTIFHLHFHVLGGRRMGPLG